MSQGPRRQASASRPGLTSAARHRKRAWHTCGPGVAAVALGSGPVLAVPERLGVLEVGPPAVVSEPGAHWKAAAPVSAGIPSAPGVREVRPPFGKKAPVPGRRVALAVAGTVRAAGPLPTGQSATGRRYGGFCCSWLRLLFLRGNQYGCVLFNLRLCAGNIGCGLAKAREYGRLFLGFLLFRRRVL